MGTKVNLDINSLRSDQIIVAGTVRYVILLPEHAGTYGEAVESAAAQKRDACQAQLLVVLKHLGDVLVPQLPKTSFRHEGEGIWAAKARCGLRAWGWYGDARKGQQRQPVFAISFFTMKNGDKANPADLASAKIHRTQYDK